MIRDNAIRYVLATLLPLAATPAAALPSPMVHPNLARGDAEAVHHFPFDRVNAFNGNLRIDLPIGQSYPLSERLSYRLTLAYNSNAWDLSETALGTVRADPMAHSNAGMGWDLSLGRLVPPSAVGNSIQRWIYVSPDGKAHPFYETLHPGHGTVTHDIFYTRDGTYMRLRKLGASTAVVEAGDGETRTFTYDAAGGGWRLTKISDPFGNHLSISYGSHLWTLTDSRGRTHSVVFADDPTGTYDRLVRQVVVAAFAGTTATYGFGYQTLAVDRPTVDDDPATAVEATVPLLSLLTLPDGTSYAFGYGAKAAWGGIVTMTLPTLGRVEWDWGDYVFARGAGCGGGDLPPILHRNRGVAARRTLAADGALVGTWTLSRSGAGSHGRACVAGIKLAVHTPPGDIHFYYFTVTTGPATGGDPGAYGKPGHATVGDGLGRSLVERENDCDPGGLNCALTRSWYRRVDQDAAASPLAFDGLQVNRRVASQRTFFHDDGNHWADVDWLDFDGLGHFRRHATSGSFGRADVVERFVDYDVSAGTYPSGGWSHPSPSQPWVLHTFREATISDAARAERVDYCFDPATGRQTRKRLRVSATAPSAHDVVTTFTYDAAGNLTDERRYGGDLQAVGTTSDLCVLTLPSSDQYRTRHGYQHGVRSTSWFAKAGGGTMGFYTLDRTIDRNTGLPSSQRDVAGFQTDLEYDATGRLIRELPQPGGGARVHYTYRKATGSTRETVGCVLTDEYSNDGSELLGQRRNCLDGFGRPWWDREHHHGSQWLNRMRVYDAMGRLTAETEGGVSWGRELVAGNVVHYLDHDPQGRPGRIVHSDGTEETIEHYGERRAVRTFQRAYYRDTSGIVEKDQVVETTKDRQGRVWKVKTTRYTDKDWDGPPTITVEEYHHDSQGRRTAELENGLDLVSHTYDGRGYLVETNRRILPGIGRLITTYGSHDPLGLAHQKTSTRQQYSIPGAWDEVQRAERIYDRAGRLVKVRDPDAHSITWRDYVYGTENATDAQGNVDWQKGRLVRAVRHHWEHAASIPNYWHYWDNVKQLYSYEASGRVRRFETYVEGNLSGWAGLSYVQSYTYDDLGRVVRWAFESGQGDPGYTLDYTYDAETLESVIGTNHLGQSTNERWIVSQNHAEDGMVSRVERGNGVVEVVSGDDTSIARPGRVQLQGMERWSDSVGWTDFTWDSGTFQYDGRGVTVRRGTDYLVPWKWDASSTSETHPPLHPCWQGYADPEDLRLVSWANQYCTWREPTWSFDHEGYVISTRDESSDWSRTVRDLQGRLVWQSIPFSGQGGSYWYWGTHYIVYVYDPEGELLGEVRREVKKWSFGSEQQTVTHRHHHPETPVATDALGRWINEKSLP